MTDLRKIYPTLEAMQREGLVLLVHGEVTRSEIDVFDREKRFIDEHMRRVVERFPTLKVVFEHITTADAVQFVTEAGRPVAKLLGQQAEALGQWARATGKAIGAGWMTPNEARRRESMPPIDGGDQCYLQQQNYALSALAKRDREEVPQ